MKALLARACGAFHDRSRPAPAALVLRGLLSACMLAALCAAAPVVAASPEAGTAVNFPQTFVDRVGRTVTVRRMPERIVSLAPSNTELVFAVGAGERLAGVTAYCDFPAAAKRLPKIGGFAARTISLESIVALGPDLVLAGDQNQRLVIDALEGMGVTVAAVQPRSFEEMLEALALLGRLTGREADARRLIDRSRARIQRVVEKTRSIPPERRVRVYWEVFDQPLVSAGPRSIVGQVIALGGGINVFGDVAEEYPQVSAEWVVARDPQVVMGPASMRSFTREALLARPGWQRIAAVRENRIIVLPDEPIVRAGPRLVEGVELMARTLYPDLFAEFSRTDEGHDTHDATR